MQSQIERATETKSANWIKAILIVVLISYGWLLNLAFEPRFEPPETVARGVSWIEGQESKGWAEIRAHRSLSLGQVAYDLSRMRAQIQILGGFRQPPVILIDVNSPRHYAVSDTRVEIAEALLLSEGQLRKALLKSWVLQVGAPHAKSSLLRLEVVSDVLSAMLSARPGFELPESNKRSEFPRVTPWLRHAASLTALCGSPWASLDLQGRCGNGDEIHALAFRSLLASMMWQAYLSVGSMERLAFVRAWANYLRQPIDLPSVESNPDTLAAWKNWLRAEFESLLPVAPLARAAGLSEHAMNELIRAKDQILAAAAVRESDPLEVELVFYGDRGMVQELKPRGLAKNQSYVVIERGAHSPRLYPHGVRISESDLSSVVSPLVVNETCANQQLREVLALKPAATRILHIYSCDPVGRAEGWAALAYGGLADFSYARLDAGFVVMSREQMEFAIKRSAIDSTAPMISLIRGQASPLIGLAQAQWKREIGAFRALGVIEAVEWFRPANTKMDARL